MMMIIMVLMIGKARKEMIQKRVQVRGASEAYLEVPVSYTTLHAAVYTLYMRRELPSTLLMPP